MILNVGDECLKSHSSRFTNFKDYVPISSHLLEELFSDLPLNSFFFFFWFCDKIAGYYCAKKPNVYLVCFLLGDSPASDLYMPTFQNTLSVPSSKAGVK